MRRAWPTVFTVIMTMIVPASATCQEKILFSCSFRDRHEAPWKTIGGKWEIKGECLTQSVPDPDARSLVKALVGLGNQEDLSTDVLVTAKLRINAMKGDDTRTGISICTNPDNGRGLNLVFHQGQLAFLHDHVVWGTHCPFRYEPDGWYWIKLYKKSGEKKRESWIDGGETPGDLKGKAWVDGDKEPENWMVSWTSFDDSLTGYPGLNGGCSVSFAQFTVTKVPRPESTRRGTGTTISLNGTWEVRPQSLECAGEAGLAQVRQTREGWLPAQVPGEIHLDLMKAGQMPEPTLGTNMPHCRWPETKSWWYRTTLEVREDFLRHERQQLVFDGLDLYAQVFVNGHGVGEAADAFVPAVFDLQGRLHAGKNELVVRLTAGSELAPDDSGPDQGQRPHKPTFGKIPNPAREGDPYGHRVWYGRKWLRKPPFAYGWDWIDALPNIGIWRNVRLEGRSHAVLDDIRLDTRLQDGQASLEMEAVVENLHPWTERACELRLDIQSPDGGPVLQRRYSLDVPPGRMPVRDMIPVPNPRLWWPNGLGDQPLYQVTARVLDRAGRICDARHFCIGLRTIAIDRKRLAEGSRFCVRVNGQDVFCRGGNLGPHDVIPARIGAAKYQALVSEARNAHMTIFRINGCSFFKDPAFYEACDRAGILIWHDFMMACTTYPEEDRNFRAAVSAETESAVRLLRHHPSIALWCGNNECTWGLDAWWNPNKAQPLELGGRIFYNQIFPDLCRRLDPRRPYWPGSPCGGQEPNSELSGDCHWWEPAFTSSDLNRRIRHEVFDECRARFVSEYGVIGPCHLDSLRTFLTPEEMKPGTPAWRTHTNQFEGNTLAAAIRLHYADPEKLTVPEYVVYGQMFQAFLHGHAMEALRFRKRDPVNDCEGALIWSYSDCWGEIGWSLLDYYLRRKPSYYWVRRACAPVKVIVRKRTDRLVTRVVNDTMHPVQATVELGWWRLDGTQKDVQVRSIKVEANGMQEITAAKLPQPKERDPRQWLYGAVLRGKEGRAVDQSIWLFEPYRQLALKTGPIKVVRVSDRCLEVSCPTFAHAVHLEDHGRERISDNWFDLLPGVPVQVRVAPGEDPASIQLDAIPVISSSPSSKGT